MGWSVTLAGVPCHNDWQERHTGRDRGQERDVLAGHACWLLFPAMTAHCQPISMAHELAVHHRKELRVMTTITTSNAETVEADERPMQPHACIGVFDTK